MVALALGHVHIVLLCLYMNDCTVPKYTSSNHVGTKDVHCACGQY